MPVQYIPHPIRANVRDETATRLLDVAPWNVNVYQNQSLRPIMVMVTCDHVMVNVAASCLASGFIGPVTANQEVSVVGPFALSANAFSCILNLVFMVPPGNFYRVPPGVALGNTVTLRYWFEVDL